MVFVLFKGFFFVELLFFGGLCLKVGGRLLLYFLLLLAYSAFLLTKPSFSFLFFSGRWWFLRFFLAFRIPLFRFGGQFLVLRLCDHDAELATPCKVSAFGFWEVSEVWLVIVRPFGSFCWLVVAFGGFVGDFCWSLRLRRKHGSNQRIRYRVFTLLQD